MLALFRDRQDILIDSMHRASLLVLLHAYCPLDEADAACRARFVTFVEANPLCFERALLIGHVTGSAWIVDATGCRVLLTHHRKLNLWLQPGGHADGDPDVAAVALHEASEETGLTGLELDGGVAFDVDVHRIPARADVPEHDHYDVRFVIRATGAPDFVVSDESHALAWVPIDEIERYTREYSILRMREKWRRLRM
jgi:8-oxo-dGTP pyrophosphatase MutT (NUDIX family)